MSLQPLVKTAGDTLSVGTVIGTVLQILPPIAALFAIVWTSMCMYEMIKGIPFSKTPLGLKISNYLNKRKESK